MDGFIFSAPPVFDIQISYFYDSSYWPESNGARVKRLLSGSEIGYYLRKAKLAFY